MEVVCCPSQSNVFYGGEVSGCRALKRLDLKTKLKYRYSHCNIFGDLKCKSSTYSLRRKNTEYCFSSGSQGISKGGNLWMRRYSSNGHSASDGRICKISKHLCLSQPQDNEPVAHATGGCGDGEVYEAVENEVSLEAVASKEISKEEVAEAPGLDELRDLLRKALKDLEVARLNRKLYEGKAQQISEAAIALKDDAENARNDLNGILFSIQEIEKEEAIPKEGVQKAAMALSLAEARLQVAMKTAQGKHESAKDSKVSDSAYESRDISSDQEMLLAAQKDVEACQVEHENCEEELRRLQRRKEELNKEMDRLNAVEAQAQLAEEEVANIMLLAEQAVSYELQAAQCVNDAEIALRRVEKNPALSSIDTPDSTVEATISEYLTSFENAADEDWKGIDKDSFLPEPLLERQLEELRVSNDSEKVETQLSGDQVKEKESEQEKIKTIQSKIQEMQKESARNHSPFTTPRSFIKKSSWFFSACFFSFSADEEKFMPASAFRRILEAAKKQLPKLIFGSLLVGAGITLYVNQRERVGQLCQQLQITSSADGDSTTAKPLARQMRQLSVKMKKVVDMLPHQEIKEEEAFLCDVLWLLLASVIFVPIFRKLPGGSPILGYLVAGILIGPYGISIIRNVHETKAVAEFGVVFLLFNIGLELSIERLSSMKKYVFGLGSAQVLATAVALGLLCHYVAGLSGPAALVTGSGLALSSTAVVLQVLQERGESTSRHGRATFSVLLFQDLAVVVLLILIPLLSPSSSKGGVGFHAIAEALGLAAVKAFAAISVIITGGRVLLRPIYNQIAAEGTDSYIFTATTLLVVLGTSLFTARAGLSMALGAFLAGLLLAETEFFLQIESDISLFRALLLGLFFMTVGMSIDPKSLVSNFSVVTGSVGLLIVGKTILVALVGRLFDLSMVSAVRVGLLLGPGGEFAFVAFGEAVNQGIISAELSSLLFLVVGISMAITPWLAAGGQLITSWFELQDVRNLLPVETETDDLQDHVIVCGFGRVGQIIAQILSSHLIPFVALDVRGDRVALGRSMELPVYFGDAGSREVLRKIGAERACAAAITLDSAGSNYRTLWALSKHFPNVKTFVRAHDVAHGVNLEKAGATAVVPEILAPSLELAAAVLSQTKFPNSEIDAAINECRSGHLSKLRAQSEAHGYSFGYGFPQIKPISHPSDTSSEDKQSSPGTRPE